jgi:hypothetical protein
LIAVGVVVSDRLPKSGRAQFFPGGLRPVFQLVLKPPVEVGFIQHRPTQHLRQGKEIGAPKLSITPAPRLTPPRR